MFTRARFVFAFALVGALIALPANAQSGSRDTGWEVGFDLNYLLSNDVDFEGGSTLETSDEFGVSGTFGYRMNANVEFQFSIDWANVDYDATLVSALPPPLPASIGVSGEMESFTLMAKAVYNFMDGPFTPYVSGGIGWSFIDTNIPEGQVQVGCWWDPWYGQICAPYQETKNTDSFVYGVGLGVRYDFGYGSSIRASYDINWLDLSHSDGAADFDQFRIGYVFRY